MAAVNKNLFDISPKLSKLGSKGNEVTPRERVKKLAQR